MLVWLVAGGLSAVISVELTKWTLVALLAPNCTVEVGMNPVPLMSVEVPPTAGPRSGVIDVTDGGASMSEPVAWQNDCATLIHDAVVEGTEELDLEPDHLDAGAVEGRVVAPVCAPPACSG